MPQLVGEGQARAAGDTCDAYINDGWWQGARVLALKVRGRPRSSFPAGPLPAWVAA